MVEDVDPADVVPALDGDVGVAVDVPADVVPPVPEGVSAGPVVIGVPVVPVVLVELAAPVAPALPDGALVDVDDESVASALATPGEVATITPMPRAAANAPTRPIWRLYVLTCEVDVLILTPGVVSMLTACDTVYLPNVKLITCRP